MKQELKALLKSKYVPFELDAGSVNEYFHYQFVPEPKTIVKGVTKLLPGHLLCIDTKNWTIEEKQYWHILDALPPDLHR